MNDETSASSEMDAWFDRLVDGELSEQQYRRLVASLDDQPDGWRRCAVAFLEAQAWQQALGGLSREAKEKPARMPLSDRPRQPTGGWHLIWAVVASFLIAFGLGVVVRSHMPAAAPQQAAVPQTRHVDPGTALVNNQVTAPPDAPRQHSPASVADVQRQPLGHVRFVVDRDDTVDGEPLDVPVFEMDQFNLDWLGDESLFLPPELIRQITRQGHQVKRDHHFLPIELQDGRRVMIPFEQVEIVPVGSSYQ